MEFSEKLRRCSQGVNKSRAAEAVGLGPTSISNYIAKGSIPRADIALKMARALDVPLEWLVDDAQGWPPPPKSDTQNLILNLPDGDLMAEACRRLSNYAATVHKAVKEAESADWKSIVREAVVVPLDEPLPPRIAHFERLLDVLESSLERLLEFDASHVMARDPDGAWFIGNLRREAGMIVATETDDLGVFLKYRHMRFARRSEKTGGMVWPGLDDERRKLAARVIPRPARTKASKSKTTTLSGRVKPAIEP